MNDEHDTKAIQRCACANIRRTDRALTHLYDTMLAPSGLSAAQFGLLSTIAEVAPITINRLAEIMGMDQTTMTRNLQVLRKQLLMRTEPSADRRERRIMLTAEGEQALNRAWPLWQAAQARIEQAIGGERFATLLADLAAVRDLTR